MKRAPIDGRLFAPELTAKLHGEGPERWLSSPAVGLWRDAPMAGSLVMPRGSLGVLEILGVQHRLRAPDEAVGVVLEHPSARLARQPVAYGDLLVRLDPAASAVGVAQPAAASSLVADAGGLVFRSPLSGRFYIRPAPGKPAFVKPGDVIEAGRTVALLEVMKTFNRISYGGEGLPTRVRVLEVVPTDESDVDDGEVLLRVEPA